MKLKTNLKLTADIVGLDLGQARTGVARINIIARIAEPLVPINMLAGDFLQAVDQLVVELDTSAVVVGVPRNLEGMDTLQTKWSLELIGKLEANLSVPVFMIDEAGTTVEAEARASEQQSIDSVAACIIVENFLDEVIGGRIPYVSV